jgi:hypothetical protein
MNIIKIFTITAFVFFCSVSGLSAPYYSADAMRGAFGDDRCWTYLTNLYVSTNPLLACIRSSRKCVSDKLQKHETKLKEKLEGATNASELRVVHDGFLVDIRRYMSNGLFKEEFIVRVINCLNQCFITANLVSEDLLERWFLVLAILDRFEGCFNFLIKRLERNVMVKEGDVMLSDGQEEKFQFFFEKMFQPVFFGVGDLGGSDRDLDDREAERFLRISEEPCCKSNYFSWLFIELVCECFGVPFDDFENTETVVIMQSLIESGLIHKSSYMCFSSPYPIHIDLIACGKVSGEELLLEQDKTRLFFCRKLLSDHLAKHCP